MGFKKHIPNFFTCSNLLCGCFGIAFAFEGKLEFTALLVLLAAVFDFLDGFMARLLKAYSEIGKQLDSLADLVSFGMVPGFIVFHLMSPDISVSMQGLMESNPNWMYLRYIGFLIPVFSALRLAKFNIDTRQTDSFLGVPTPANALLFASFPLILIGQPLISNVNFSEEITNVYYLSALTIIMCLLMVSEIPLISFKFKSFKWKGNEVRFVFLLLSIAAIVFLQFMAIPIIIFLYILISILNTYILKR